ncbi:MAG: flagellar basal body-associated FliL family protein [Pseudomonadota bacterium]
MSDLAVEDEEELEELSRTKVGGKRVVLIVVALLVLLLGGGAGLYFTGMLDPLLGPSEEEIAAAEAEAAEDEASGVFYDIDNMMVNLNAPGRQPRFLKMSISIELGSESDVAKLEQLLPRVNDQFQTYLRELRVEDLQGSAGIYRLRLELLDRVSQAVEPAEVRNVLFREMLIQ